MEKISNNVIKYQKLIIAIFMILTVIMTICVINVNINYNMQDYLPESANSTKAIKVMQEEFNDSITNSTIMISNVSINEAIKYKEKIKDIEGVESISWLDDILDEEILNNIDKGIIKIENLDSDAKNTINSYYKNNNALFQISIKSGSEQKTVNEIYDLIGDDNSVVGSAVEQANAQNIALTQSIKAIILIAPLIILILLLSTTSWIEPFIYLTTIGIAVVINLGLNIFRGSISYVTLAVAPLLQLAVSLDYAVFLSNSFDNYRKDMDIKSAMKMAMKDSLKSISASALTTLFGFVALLFMKFKIGPDMGFSLVIGVLLSFIAVLTLLPALILSTYKLNDKCKHRKLLPSFNKLSTGIIKTRIPLFIIIIVMIVISFNMQKNVTYMYGSGAASEGSRIDIDTKKIESTFGRSNMVAILVPIGSNEKETKLSKKLEELEYVDSVISYANNVGFEIPESMVPNDTKSKFYSKKYSRIILSTKLDDEGEESFKKIEEIKDIVSNYYDLDNTYMCGNTVNMYDMKNTIKNDNKVVSIITIISIFIILLIEFKSLIIPIILILSVKSSIWITMAISGISGVPINYLGYLVVSTVMMGATIDYAILITDNYIKNRKNYLAKEAMINTLSSTIKSILVSALTLAFAGFALGLTSEEGVVKSLGMMLGEGTVIAFVISITLLPVILLIVDKLIPILSIKMNFKKN